MACYPRHYSSNNVETEYKRRFQQKKDYIRKEAQKARAIIIGLKTIDPNILYFKLDGLTIRETLLRFIEKNAGCDFKRIARELSNLIWDMEKRCDENDGRVHQSVQFCRRTVAYANIYKVFDDAGLLNPKSVNDLEIVLDAHDVSEQIGNIFLITGDYAHIASQKIKAIIKQNTSIKDIIGLGEFDQSKFTSG